MCRRRRWMQGWQDLGAFQTIYQVKMLNLRPDIPDSASPAVRDLLGRCWTLEPSQRPSFREIHRALKAIIAAGDWVPHNPAAKIFVD